MINPSEISQVLKQQLDNVNSKVSFEETGIVLEVGDGVAHVYGLDNVCANELVEFENGVKGVALNLEESNVGVILLNNVNSVTENMTVKRTGEIASIHVGDGLFGRVINVLGQPIDGRGPIQGELLPMPLERKAPGVIFRQPVNQPLQTGLKAVATVRSVRLLSPSTLSSISARTLRKASPYIVYMSLSARKPRRLPLRLRLSASTERSTIR